jgi:hypothetical protein
LGLGELDCINIRKSDFLKNPNKASFIQEIFYEQEWSMEKEGSAQQIGG